MLQHGGKVECDRTQEQPLKKFISYFRVSQDYNSATHKNQEILIRSLKGFQEDATYLR